MHWKNLFLYGIALGLLLALLQFSRYKLMVLTHAEEWYIGLIALLFTALGIWAGGKMMAQKTVGGVAAPPAPHLPKPDLMEQHNITPREYEVLVLMAEGLSNQEIADRLFVSLHTVKTHASNLLSKLDAQRRTQAIQRAKALGILV